MWASSHLPNMELGCYNTTDEKIVASASIPLQVFLDDVVDEKTVTLALVTLRACHDVLRDWKLESTSIGAIVSLS
jgi:hypothetical protein